jgi:hypothetical protein
VRDLKNEEETTIVKKGISFFLGVDELIGLWKKMKE